MRLMMYNSLKLDGKYKISGTLRGRLSHFDKH